MKTKKEHLSDMLDAAHEKLLTLEITAGYLNSKLIADATGKGDTELMLGQAQKQIKEQKEFKAYLERQLKQEK